MPYTIPIFSARMVLIKQSVGFRQTQNAFLYCWFLTGIFLLLTGNTGDRHNALIVLITLIKHQKYLFVKCFEISVYQNFFMWFWFSFSMVTLLKLMENPQPYRFIERQDKVGCSRVFIGYVFLVLASLLGIFFPVVNVKSVSKMWFLELI